MHHSTDFDTSDSRMMTDAMLIRSDFACILSHTLNECERGLGTLPARLGLTSVQIEDLLSTWFPGVMLPDVGTDTPERLADQDAISLLLMWRGGSVAPESLWLSAIIARRAMETRHLWEDLGLPSRTALSALMKRHFPKIFAANSQNMRWKKFFYRQICSDQDFALCLSPTCDDCPEKAECFAPD